MIVSLPQNDKLSAARKSQLEKSRETYRYAYDWPEGVATSAELPTRDKYSPGYLVKTSKVYAEIGVNLAAMAVEEWEPKKAAEALKSKFEGLTKPFLQEPRGGPRVPRARRVPSLASS